MNTILPILDTLRALVAAHQIDVLLATCAVSILALLLSLWALLRRRSSRRLRRTIARMQSAIDHLHGMEAQRMMSKWNGPQPEG